ncbi:MAG: hypothetical protein H0X02_03770 [Nitrosomonas sp.]|nr:hypothetical protein [Nitrosomonas sp.]
MNTCCLVWLAKAGLEFELADGCKRGSFNLVMWCQRVSVTQIADNWCNHEPIEGVDLNWQ